MHWKQVFLQECFVLCAVCQKKFVVRYYRVDGKAAAADSTAVLSFMSMEMMLQSIAAEKTSAKRDDLLMVRFLSCKKFFLVFVFNNWMPGEGDFLARFRKTFAKDGGTLGIYLKKREVRLFYIRQVSQRMTERPSIQKKRYRRENI